MADSQRKSDVECVRDIPLYGAIVFPYSSRALLALLHLSFLPSALDGPFLLGASYFSDVVMDVVVGCP